MKVKLKAGPSKPEWEWSREVACDPVQLREILALSPRRAFDLDAQGLGAIHLAAHQGAIEALNLLMERGGEKVSRLRSDAKYTPAMMAAGKGESRALAAILAKAGAAALDDVDEAGRSAFEWAILNAREECARMLMPAPGQARVASSGEAFDELAQSVGLGALAMDLRLRRIAGQERAEIGEAAGGRLAKGPGKAPRV